MVKHIVRLSKICAVLLVLSFSSNSMASGHHGYVPLAFVAGYIAHKHYHRNSYGHSNYRYGRKNYGYGNRYSNRGYSRSYSGYGRSNRYYGKRYYNYGSRNRYYSRGRY